MREANAKQFFDRMTKLFAAFKGVDVKSFLKCQWNEKKSSAQKNCIGCLTSALPRSSFHDLWNALNATLSSICSAFVLKHFSFLRKFKQNKSLGNLRLFLACKKRQRGGKREIFKSVQNAGDLWENIYWWMLEKAAGCEVRWKILSLIIIFDHFLIELKTGLVFDFKWSKYLLRDFLQNSFEKFESKRIKKIYDF